MSYRGKYRFPHDNNYEDYPMNFRMLVGESSWDFTTFGNLEGYENDFTVVRQFGNEGVRFAEDYSPKCREFNVYYHGMVKSRYLGRQINFKEYRGFCGIRMLLQKRRNKSPKTVLQNFLISDLEKIAGK